METILMRISSLIFSIAVVVVCSTLSAAQGRVKEVKFGDLYVPDSKYVMPTDAGNVKTGSRTRQHRQTLFVAMDISTRIDTASGKIRLWNANVIADYLTMSHENYSVNVLPESLLASAVMVQHYRSLRNKWAFLLLASAGINSDLERVDGNDIFVNGGGLFIKSFSPRLSVGFGLFVNNNFGSPLPWPALTVNWQVGGKYRLDINVPDRAPGLSYNISFTRKLGSTADVAVFFRPGVTSYDIEGGQDGRRLLNNWQIPIGLRNGRNLGAFRVAAEGGLMALRSFDYAKKDLSKMFDKNPYHHLRANFFIGLTAGYTFDKRK